MILTKEMYVPALRWRQGEYQALFLLSETVKERIVPFISIPDLEFDFETHEAKKSVHDHVSPFAKRFKLKWGRRPAWINVHPNIIEKPMADGRDILSYVFDALRAFDASAIPAIALNASAQIITPVRTILATDNLGVAVTIRLEDLMKADTRILIDGLADALGVNLNEIDLVIDLGAPNFKPYTTFASALIAVLRRLGNIHVFRNLVMIGTAIPDTFRDVAKGEDQLPRHEWLFYQTFIRQLPDDVRQPSFGDYTIVHPEFTPMDMRMIKSSGKLVYTTTEAWEVRKGVAFRDNRDQMYDHCASIASSVSFKGAQFSFGDAYIAKCAIRDEKPSNQTRWKAVAINHHITLVLEDLAKLVAAS
ncbi:MAG: beta family protein [Cyanobacteria bacterium]|nr:beta family protein [Cyanobacteriota bacterium]